MNRIESLRRTAARFATEVPRLRVIDTLDDPLKPELQLKGGPYKATTEKYGDTDRYVNLTIELEDNDPVDEAYEAVFKDAVQEWFRRIRTRT